MHTAIGTYHSLRIKNIIPPILIPPRTAEPIATKSIRLLVLKSFSISSVIPVGKYCGNVVVLVELVEHFFHIFDILFAGKLNVG